MALFELKNSVINHAVCGQASLLSITMTDPIEDNIRDQTDFEFLSLYRGALVYFFVRSKFMEKKCMGKYLWVQFFFYALLNKLYLLKNIQ